ncbi:MAG TPA: hypothetical protein VFR53_11185, partial [Methylomirabilota bacterium]|nr:hypothetical protein [Methylomirabilota bacterium]
MVFDLILRGGRVLDPGRGTDATLDVPNGVTTAVDAGSAGWATYAGFREHVIARADTRVCAFLHLATTIQTLAIGEANTLPALEMARRIADDMGKRIMVQ